MNRDDNSDYSRVDLDSAVVREYDTIDTSAESDDPEVIRANIEQTRAEMSETVNALQERLSPTAIKEQAQEQFHDVKEQVKEQVQEQIQHAKEAVREATIGRVEHMVSNASDTFNETRTSVADTIRQNPIPAALVGIGLGWLFMNRSSAQPVRYSGRGSVRGGGRGSQVYNQGGRDYRVNYNTAQGNQPYYADAYEDQRFSQVGPRYQNQQSQGMVGSTISGARDAAGNVVDTVSDTASSVASTVSDTASNVASTVSNTASNVVDQAQETVSYLTDQAQYQAQRVEDRFQQALSNNPLAVGAITLALGTAVGLAIPQTQRENQLMGEARDTLIDRAQDVASETIEKVQRVASEVTDEAKQTVKEQAREQGLTS